MGMASKILLTGVAGFIGYHAAKALLEEGNLIIGIDNLNEYYDKTLKESRLDLLKQYPNFKFYKEDISNLEQIQKIIVENQPQKILHLAAQAGVRYSLEAPFVYSQSNLVGTLNLLECARNNKIKHFIFASTSSVYGKNKELPFQETQNIQSPVSLYAATKIGGEAMCHSYAHLFGINTTILRFFTVYGPYGRPDMALFKFTKYILENKPIDVYNNGEMKRDFTYVEDIVNGIVKATKKEFSFEIINLAYGTSIPLMEFVKAIEKATGNKANINFQPMQPGDMVETYGGITKAKNLLGYGPKTPVEEGVKKFVEWYISYKNENSVDN